MHPPNLQESLVLKKQKLYESSEIKGLRFINTRGIEYGEYNIDSVINEAKTEIEKRLEKNNLGDFFIVYYIVYHLEVKDFKIRMKKVYLN